MKQLEIISLKTSGHYKQQATKYMRKFCRIVKKYHSSDANFYVRASIPGDLALIISSQVQEGEEPGTSLGVYMAAILKHFGIVDYNCWLIGNNK